MNTAINSFHTTSISMQILDGTILVISLFFTSLVVGADWEYLAIAAGGSFSGAVVLAYFRRDSRKVEQMFKTLSSSISGLICGSTITEYLAVASPRFNLMIYFLCGLLSLVMLRALFNLTEKNAADACKHALQRLLGMHLESERPRRNRRPKKEQNDYES